MHRLTLALDAQDPDRLASFWSALLGREVRNKPRGPSLPGTDTQVGLRFVASDAPRAGLNRVHLHLTSDHPTGQAETVADALDLGATHLDVGQLPDEPHIVLADPEGNEFCVIPFGNRFLAGCGFLGELACDGTRDVGVFWAAALDWPLVWDQDGETAVQSPAGGTKVAWGGPPVSPPSAGRRQRFELAVPAARFDAEVDRLLGLGAGRTDDTRTLTDPDGHEFRLEPT